MVESIPRNRLLFKSVRAFEDEFASLPPVFIVEPTFPTVPQAIAKALVILMRANP